MQKSGSNWNTDQPNGSKEADVHFTFRRAPPDLAPFISIYIEYSGNIGVDKGHIFKLLPSPYIWLNIPLHVPKLVTERVDNEGLVLRANRQPQLLGYIKTPYIWSGLTSVMGISVQVLPEAAQTLFDISVNDLDEKAYDMSSVWGLASSTLMDRLHATNSARQRFKILDEFFRARLKPVEPTLYHASRLLSEYCGPHTVEKVSRYLNVTPRAVHARAVNQLGVGPKTLARLGRFFRTAQIINKRSIQPKKPIAPDEYYDDAHKIKEFKAFSGLTPAEFDLLKRTSNCGPLGAVIGQSLDVSRYAKPTIDGDLITINRELWHSAQASSITWGFEFES